MIRTLFKLNFFVDLLNQHSWISNFFYLGVGIVILVGLTYYVLKKQSGYNNVLLENSSTNFLTIKIARLITLFAAVIIPLSGLIYYFALEQTYLVTCIHIVLGLVLFALLGLSYFLKLIKDNVLNYVVINFFVVLAFYQAILYFSSLESYYMISLVLLITTGGAIIHSLRVYIVMISVIILSSTTLVYVVQEPHYNVGLFLFGILSSCSIGMLILTVKLNLAEKLIFSDTIVNKGNSLVLVANNKGEIIFVSENITQMLGYATDEVLGNEWWRLTTPDEGSELKKTMFIDYKREKKHTYNRLVKHKDGTTRWIQWTDKHFSDELTFGIGTDITKEKEYQERFEYLVNNANDLIYTTDSNGNFTFANQMVLKITERSVEDFLKLNFLEIVDPKYKKEVKLFYINAVRNRVNKTYHEFPIVTKNNKQVWVGQSVTNKFNVETNVYEGTEVICRDITDRVIIQKKLDDTNKQLGILNKIKENILKATSIDEVCNSILDALINSANVTHLMSIHINNDWQKKSFVYSAVESREKQIEFKRKEYEDYEPIQTYFPHLVSDRELYLTKEEVEIWKPLFFYLEEEYLSSLIVPIIFDQKIIGFINFFSIADNAYSKADSFLLNDIANSVNAFLKSFKQTQIIEEKNYEIEKNNLRLDILNKSKQNLLSASTIEEVHRELILVLTTNLQNIDRVSTCEFDFKHNTAQLYFLNTVQNYLIDSKTVLISEISAIEYLTENKFYYRPNLTDESGLINDDKHWYSVGIRSVLSAPIFINKELYGCINLLSSIPNNFDDSHTTLIKEIVDSTALIIEQIMYKNIINDKNKDITDNIIYAKRIQDAIMPKEEVLKNTIPDSFLMFSQKEILGGDFYWFDCIDNKTYIVVGDCTGHGVSGALLSILASDIIKQAVLELRLTDPGMILQHLNHKILSTLNQSTYKTSAENEIVDGLDISFAVINHSQKSIYFSSAMHTAFFMRNNELVDIRGNRKPIGASYKSEHDFFATHILSYKECDIFYFLTDGYCDQFHYKTSKKFGKARLRQLLLEINELSMVEQCEKVNNAHNDWKKNSEQTDDICLIGIKL